MTELSEARKAGQRKQFEKDQRCEHETTRVLLLIDGGYRVLR